jgi:hypothetical protein
MTDQGSDNEPDLWANTGNQPFVPPTAVQPAVPSKPEPTAVQPVTPGPLSAPAASAAVAGYVTGPGTPPPVQPPNPPSGGPGGPGSPGGPSGPGSGRPAWAAPAAIGVLVAVVAAGLIYLITRDDDGDDIVSTDVSTTTAIGPETTIAAETTIATETTVTTETTIATETTITTETTVAPTTAAPTTAAPTTAAPTTVAPTTTAPEGITPSQPGQALVAGVASNIASGCTTIPAPGYSVRSYVTLTESGPLIIEEGNDDGNTFGLFSDSGNPIDTEEYTELGDGFGMIVLQGDGGFEVAVNPDDVVVEECSTLGSARLSDPAAPDSGYNYGVVDVCATTTPFRAIAYISEGGNIRVVDNGDGTAQVTLNTSDLFDATDPDATITDAGGRLTIIGAVTGSTIDGDTTQAINFEFDSSAARACTSSESP